MVAELFPSGQGILANRDRIGPVYDPDRLVANVRLAFTGRSRNFYILKVWFGNAIVIKVGVTEYCNLKRRRTDLRDARGTPLEWELADHGWHVGLIPPTIDTTCEGFTMFDARNQMHLESLMKEVLDDRRARGVEFFVFQGK